ncbi:MAG TPA: hypothetical protein VEA60_10310 [Allosphingosinicella sp.]|nr:hypothetical protein [Allosphingosinicella sp.]
MNKILLSMAAVGALAAAAPAAAQYGYGSNVNSGISISNRIAQLEARLQAGIAAGEINRAEARGLRMELRQIRRLERQYSYNGFTRAERLDLQARLRNFRQDLRLADNNRFDRDMRYGAWNDPFWNDGYSGRGGPYEPAYDVVCEERRGIGGVIDSVLGRENCYSLTVGARATGNLYAVPSQYRYRYRDGNGVYYRSDGRAIYEIDARTNTVLRIHDID